jgi:hypothetical protein
VGQLEHHPQVGDVRWDSEALVAMRSVSNPRSIKDVVFVIRRTQREMYRKLGKQKWEILRLLSNPIQSSTRIVRDCFGYATDGTFERHWDEFPSGNVDGQNGEESAG